MYSILKTTKSNMSSQEHLSFKEENISQKSSLFVPINWCNVIMLKLTWSFIIDNLQFPRLPRVLAANFHKPMILLIVQAWLFFDSENPLNDRQSRGKSHWKRKCNKKIGQMGWIGQVRSHPNKTQMSADEMMPQPQEVGNCRVPIHVKHCRQNSLIFLQISDSRHPSYLIA